MSAAWTWTAVGVTVVVLVLYELLLLLLQRRQPERLARAKHAGLREDWFLAVSQQKGSEVLAVQTLRNSLMSATMLASTAALALMGTVTLAAPSLHARLEAAQGISSITPRLVLELVLLTLLCVSLVSTMMAVRFYNHAGFIGAMPVDSEARGDGPRQASGTFAGRESCMGSAFASWCSSCRSSRPSCCRWRVQSPLYWSRARFSHSTDISMIHPRSEPRRARALGADRPACGLQGATTDWPRWAYVVGGRPWPSTSVTCCLRRCRLPPRRLVRQHRGHEPVRSV